MSTPYNLATIQEIELLGEHPALDFVNTAGSHPPAEDEEFLSRYEKLIDWGEYVGSITTEAADHLRELAAARPDAAQAALEKAIAMREAIFAMLNATAQGQAPTPQVMAAFNRALSESLNKLELNMENGTYEYCTPCEPDDLLQMIYLPIWQASQLLVTDARKQLRTCDSDTCDWMFLDTSKNHSRRWCDMKRCGNREKARAHYRRKRSTVEIKQV